jgi:hypothetical protein
VGKLIKGGNCMRKYGTSTFKKIQTLTDFSWVFDTLSHFPRKSLQKLQKTILNPSLISKQKKLKNNSISLTQNVSRSSLVNWWIGEGIFGEQDN